MIPLIGLSKSGNNKDTKNPFPIFFGCPRIYSILQVDFIILFIESELSFIKIL